MWVRWLSLASVLVAPFGERKEVSKGRREGSRRRSCHTRRSKGEQRTFHSAISTLKSAFACHSAATSNCTAILLFYYQPSFLYLRGARAL